MLPPLKYRAEDTTDTTDTRSAGRVSSFSCQKNIEGSRESFLKPSGKRNVYSPLKPRLALVFSISLPAVPFQSEDKGGTHDWGYHSRPWSLGSSHRTALPGKQIHTKCPKVLWGTELCRGYRHSGAEMSNAIYRKDVEVPPSVDLKQTKLSRKLLIWTCICTQTKHFMFWE